VLADLAIALGVLTTIALALALARRGGTMDHQEQLEIEEIRPFAYALTLPCLKCGALTGQPCTTETGEYAAETHKVRRRQAALKPVTEEDR
jgi:hypothetical protein